MLQPCGPVIIHPLCLVISILSSGRKKKKKCTVEVRANYRGVIGEKYTLREESVSINRISKSSLLSKYTTANRGPTSVNARPLRLFSSYSSYRHFCFNQRFGCSIFARLTVPLFRGKIYLYTRWDHAM